MPELNSFNETSLSFIARSAMSEGNIETAVTLALFEIIRDEFPEDSKKAMQQSIELANITLKSYDHNKQSDHLKNNPHPGVIYYNDSPGQIPAYVNNLPMPVESIMRKIKR